MCTGALSVGEKGVGNKVDHSSPDNAELKSGGAIPPLPNTSS
jgi:hypothetical protein